MMLSPNQQRLTLNIFSSYANVGLMALITLLVVPIYVHTLGAMQWGVVALCMTVQGLLFSIDVALAPLMLRDIARAAQCGQQQTVYRRFLRLYAGFALSFFLFGQLAVLAAQHLSMLSTAPISDELAWALHIVLVQFLFQFVNNAAIGYWNGLERQRFANLRLAGFTLIKHALALSLITQWPSSAAAYLAPFAAIGALEFAINHRRVRRDRDQVTAVRDSTNGIGNWRGLAGFGLAAGLGVLTTQIDRVYLSLTLPADQYGHYFLICTLILSLLSLQVPIHRAFLPRMATADSPKHVALPMLKVQLLLLVLPCLALAIFPEWVLRAWLRDPGIAAAAATPLRVMLIAVALIAMYAPGAALLLSQHRYRTMTLVNGCVLGIQLLVLILLTPMLGMTAGAYAWLGCGLMQALFAVFVWKTTRSRSALSGVPP